MVIASPTASFSLPEAKRGLYAGAGGLPRIVRTFGLQLGTEMALTGRTYAATELQKYGFCRVASSQEALMDEALALAEEIASLSPDAVIVSRAGVREAWETGSVERAAQKTQEKYAQKLLEGENMRIGLEAFAKKQKPKWVPSKL